MSTDPIISSLQDRAVSILKKTGKEAWDSWTEDERDLVVAVSQDAARVAVLSITDPDRAKAQKVFADAALDNLKVASEGTAAKVVWDVLAKIFEFGISVLLKAI